MFEVNVSKHCDFPCLGYCGEKHRVLGEIGKTERDGDATSNQVLKRDLPDVSWKSTEKEIVGWKQKDRGSWKDQVFTQLIVKAFDVNLN